MKPTKRDIADGAAILRGSGWLGGTSPDFQEAVLARCQWQWFAAGDAITHGGDISGGMFGISRGSFSVISVIGVPEAPIIHIGNAPFWFGSNPLVSGRARSISVAARSPCLVALVPQHVLSGILAEAPDRWRFISQSVLELMLLAQQVGTDLLTRDSRRRCLAVLLRVAGCRNPGPSTGVAELTQDELAGMTNMSRQTIGPILRDLADAGLISVSYRQITLHDPARLRAILDDWRYPAVG